MDVVPHRIRPIRPDDKAALERFHARLSPDARYRRYHGIKGDLTRGDLRLLTETDDVTHIARVAVDEAGEIGAVARVIAEREGDAAELAVVVADDRQGMGLGERVTVAALTAYGERGNEGPVVALVQHDNGRALRLFSRLGGRPGRPHAPGDPVPILLPVGRG